MTVWLYCICRNEARILPFLLRHYTPWVERMVFYDGGSTDGTRDIILNTPKAVLRDFEGTDALVDDEFLYYANEKWKEARGHADWVAWIDADEILYHPEILSVLKRYKDEGITLARTDGYTMVSETFPTGDTPITEQVRTGFSDWYWSKPVLFQPHVEMQWNVGRHSINDRAFTPVVSRREIKLLHYRALGLDYLRDRHNRNWSRVPERCRGERYGANCEPGYKDHHGLEWFEKMMKLKWPEVIP